MRLIALIGLVSVEKIDLTVELARHFTDAGKSVKVIDNVARMWLDPVHLSGETLMRVNGDITPQLPDLIKKAAESEMVIAAVSEAVNLENLIDALDTLRTTGTEVTTLGLIDLRTCDCFPQTRQVIELYADIVVNLPYNIVDIVRLLEQDENNL